VFAGYLSVDWLRRVGSPPNLLIIVYQIIALFVNSPGAGRIKLIIEVIEIEHRGLSWAVSRGGAYRK